MNEKEANKAILHALKDLLYLCDYEDERGLLVAKDAAKTKARIAIENLKNI